MQTTNDVIVIGSGASGGMAAWNLTRQGVDVLMLDAGTRFARAKFWTHVKPWEWNARVDRGDFPPQFYVDAKDAPFDTPPGQPFDLVRVWGRGGKTNVWGRVSLRYSDVDFAGHDLAVLGSLRPNVLFYFCLRPCKVQGKRKRLNGCLSALSFHI